MGRRLLIFDIDGTLLLNGPVTRSLFLRSFTEVTGREPAAEGLRFHGQTDRSLFRTLLGPNGTDREYERLFAAFAARFTEHLRAQYPTAEGPYTLPGVPELISSLAARSDVALALGTGNVRATAYLKLARFGLDGYFPAGGFGGEHESRADMVRAALVEAGDRYGERFEPAHSWVIGDTGNDVAAGHAAGCRVLAVGTGGSSREELAGAEAHLDDLSDRTAAEAILTD